MKSKEPIFKNLLIISFVIASIIGSGILYKKIYYENSIQDYKPARDREFIIDLFKKNSYWLTANEDFSIEFVLDTRSASKNPEDRGNLHIKVYLENNKPVGFVTYIKQKLYMGNIRLLAVDEKYRGKGYAQKLLNYAFEDLKHMGCDSVHLLTRVSNTSARSVYEKLGMKEFWTDNQYIRYKKNLS